MNSRYYILDDDGIPKKVATVLEWAEWYEKANRRIAYYERDGYWVSTVFLGINHNLRRGPPILFETMAFDDVREIRKRPWSDRLYRSHGDEMTCERYSTKDDALIGHERIVKSLNDRLDAARDLAAKITSSRNVTSTKPD